MDIYLSGDIRKDKRVDGYVLNPNHYPIGVLNVNAGGSSGGIDALYSIIVDSFDFSNNFIDRKSSFYNRGSTGGGAGVLISWDNGYKNNVYISGTSFNSYSGISITTLTSFTYTNITKNSLNINGLPSHTSLTITSATTLFGNVLIRLGEDYRAYDDTFNFILGAITTPDYSIPLSGSGVYNISFESYGTDTLDIYDGTDSGGVLLYSFPSDYYVLTSDTLNITSGNLYFNDASFLGSGNTINNLRIIKQTSGSTKFMQFNIDSDSNNFILDMYLNNNHINRYDTNGKYNEKLDFINLSPNESWVDFFIRSTDEVRLNNIKLFSIQ
jgi:hypothetical protein